MSNGTCRHVLRDHDHVVEDVAFAPLTAKPYVNTALFGSANQANNGSDGPFLASVGRDKLVILHNASNGQLICKLEGHDNWVRSVVFHPGGRFILTASDDKVGVMGGY